MEITSKLVSFIDREHDYLVQAFDVGNLFEFLDALQQYSPEAKKAVDFFLLNFIPMIAYLKAGEHLGIYIDSSDPNLFFKLEANSSGQFRAMLLPANFHTELLSISGRCRINKYSPGNPEPYISHIELSHHDLTQICSSVLKLSYQTEARVLVDPAKRYSLLVSKIPGTKIDKIETKEAISLDAYLEKRQDVLQKLTVIKLDGSTSLGLSYVSARNILFRCNCSREQFLPALKNIYKQDGEALFEKNVITITCDYCKSIYKITREDVQNFQAH